MSKERPILFSGPMVKAILEGRKTQTRRVIKAGKGFADPAVHCEECFLFFEAARVCPECGGTPHCPYGKPGDRLWVRETWAWVEAINQFLYKADGILLNHFGVDLRWKPSIHMPRRASRITLEIKNVRVERLQDITPDECEKEGIPFSVARKDAFAGLWQAINGANSWDQNPWVWVIEFRRTDV